jgi:hypothetical protein
MRKKCPRCGALFGWFSPPPKARQRGSWLRRQFDPLFACESCGAHCRERMRPAGWIAITGVFIFLSISQVPWSGEFLWSQSLPDWLRDSLVVIEGGLLGLIVGLIIRWGLKYELSNEP